MIFILFFSMVSLWMQGMEEPGRKFSNAFSFTNEERADTACDKCFQEITKKVFTLDTKPYCLIQAIAECSSSMHQKQKCEMKKSIQEIVKEKRVDEKLLAPYLLSIPSAFTSILYTQADLYHTLNKILEYMTLFSQVKYLYKEEGLRHFSAYYSAAIALVSNRVNRFVHSKTENNNNVLSDINYIPNKSTDRSDIKENLLHKEPMVSKKIGDCNSEEISNFKKAYELVTKIVTYQDNDEDIEKLKTILNTNKHFIKKFVYYWINEKKWRALEKVLDEKKVEPDAFFKCVYNHVEIVNKHSSKKLFLDDTITHTQLKHFISQIHNQFDLLFPVTIKFMNTAETKSADSSVEYWRGCEPMAHINVYKKSEFAFDSYGGILFNIVHEYGHLLAYDNIVDRVFKYTDSDKSPPINPFITIGMWNRINRRNSLYERSKNSKSIAKYCRVKELGAEIIGQATLNDYLISSLVYQGVYKTFFILIKTFNNGTRNKYSTYPSPSKRLLWAKRIFMLKTVQMLNFFPQCVEQKESEDIVVQAKRWRKPFICGRENMYCPLYLEGRLCQIFVMKRNSIR